MTNLLARKRFAMAAVTMRESPERGNGSSIQSTSAGARRGSRKYNPAAPGNAAYGSLPAESPYTYSAPRSISNPQPSGQTGRSFSARARDLPNRDLNYTTRKASLGTPPVFTEESTTPQGLPPVTYTNPDVTSQENGEPSPLAGAPTAPSLPSPPSRSNTVRSTSDQRRDWASDRSPLQKLEVTLTGISKEEKRARVQEAEMRLRERLARQKADREQAESGAPVPPPIMEQTAPSQSRAAPSSPLKDRKEITVGAAPIPRQPGGTAVRHSRTVSMNPQYPAIRRGDGAQYAKAETTFSSSTGNVPQRSVTMSGPATKQRPGERVTHTRSVSQSIPSREVPAVAATTAVAGAERFETPAAAPAAQGSVESHSKPKRERQTVSFNVPPPTPPPIFEWQNPPMARLGAPDFDFQTLDIDRSKAWWEGGGTSNRRKSRALPKNYQPPAQKATGEMIYSGIDWSQIH